jgi:serine/threonine-protein kinase
VTCDVSSQVRIEQLLDEILSTGRTPEDVCTDSPALLEELREWCNHVRDIEARVQALFPRSEEVPSTLDEAESLAQVPGYTVTEVLGSGGMAIVYKGIQRKLDRDVAIKMMFSSCYPPWAAAALSHEAKAIAALRHPNIVQVYDVGEVDRRPYFIMEYMCGGTLAQKLAGVPMPVADAAEMIVILARAVEAAHQRGIVHRDLKPGNVLLTVDGTPKVSDFGLATRIQGEQRVSPTGIKGRIGTPSYMAPEQALGQQDIIGPLADIYALGAILYELLTGRPPYRGESAAETERQLLSQDPVAPSRLNSRVPGDLETICLKCLEKEPNRRYATASALAEDVAHFQKGEPIEARRVGRLERSLKLVRRHPAAATAMATAAVLALVLATVGTWIVSQRSADRRALNGDLAEVVGLQRKSAWREAGLALDRASLRLGEHGPEDLRRRFDAARRDSDLVARLDAIRSASEIIKFKRTDLDYGDALRTAQLGAPGDSPDAVAARIRDSNVKSALIDGLDDWSSFSPKTRPWLLEVLRLADHDPSGWRDRVRDPAVWQNHDALVKAAASAPFADQPVPFLLSMAHQLEALNEKPMPMLIQVQEAHPDDFWVNELVGQLQAQSGNPSEGIRYLQAAVAIRPTAAIARNNLAFALSNANRLNDAITQLRAAVQIEPESPNAKQNLAILLSAAGRDAEAIPELEAAIRCDPANPNLPILYDRLCYCLAQVGRDEEAVTVQKKLISLGGSSVSKAQLNLQAMLIRQGHWDQVESVWQDAIQVDPARHDSWDGYAEYCIFVGHVDEYRKVCHQLLDRFENAEDPSVCDRAGRACLLLGDGNDQIPRAAAVVDRALHSEKSTTPRPYYLVSKGLADYRLGNFDAAVTILDGDGGKVLRPMPQLIAAMAHYRRGQEQLARRLLAESAVSFDWRRDKAITHEAWIDHTLRREAEQLILPNLNELLDGSVQPRDNDERMALLGVCTFDDLYGKCAQLWMETLSDASQSLDAHLEDAARAAAIAGTGQGKDAARFTDEDRVRWREAAVTLLSRRIDGLEGELNSAAAPTSAIRKSLLALQQSPDLAPLRDPAAVARLPKTEQDRCTTLWSHIRTLLDRLNPAS